MKSQRRILFVSRAYPPVVGGIENQNYALSQILPSYCDVRTIANPFGKKALVIFLPLMLLRLMYLMRDYDTLLLGDGVLAVLGAHVKKSMPDKKVVCIIHGLDVTFPQAIYQGFWVQKFVPTMDRIIAVSSYSRMLCVDKGLDPNKVSFVPNGVHPDDFAHADISKDALWNVIGAQHRGKRIILTSGRLARRKGVAWFITHVLRELPEDFVYVVSGDGPDRDAIHEAIDASHLHDRVVMLGYVTDDVRLMLFHTCDLFVQPNVPVEGDVEGFGLTPIEASASGLLVLASDLEGLKDAIIDGENGFSLPSGDAHAWRSKVLEVLDGDFDRVGFGRRASSYTSEHFSWDRIARLYVDHF